ncbi:MAG: hypothetical protein JWM59_3960 [Verrucomicrobiales bacterium]|nr:hypothetical protein [Verrucomicrobiales bacterium]
MGANFRAQEVLSISAHEMVFEVEDLPIPRGYDEGGDPPRVRIVLKSSETIAPCGNLHELACAVSATKFPIIEFMGSYPGQVASMIASLESIRRPVQDDELFGFVEAPYNVKLADIKPRLVNGGLHWFSVPLFGHEVMQEIRLSAKTLALVGGRQIQPVDTAWAPILRGWDTRPCLPPPAASRQERNPDS